ncbi:hypothetical protein Droror1_Dr00004988 [Drosera rotundifolia]
MIAIMKVKNMRTQAAANRRTMELTLKRSFAECLQEPLPSSLASTTGLLAGLGSVSIEVAPTRLTPLPTTPRWVTPEVPLVATVETDEESKLPLLLPATTCEELAEAEGAIELPPFCLAIIIPMMSDSIDLGLETSCCKSSSWKEKP